MGQRDIVLNAVSASKALFVLKAFECRTSLLNRRSLWVTNNYENLCEKDPVYQEIPRRDAWKSLP